VEDSFDRLCFLSRCGASDTVLSTRRLTSSSQPESDFLHVDTSSVAVSGKIDVHPNQVVRKSPFAALAVGFIPAFPVFVLQTNFENQQPSQRSFISRNEILAKVV
jgi:hypothetical protein